MTNFSIGTLARQSGIKVTTIRYYEETGLMPPAERAENHRRIYGRQDVERLSFIRHARELGFDMEAIREMLALSAEPDRPCAEVDAIARKHLTAVEERIERLERLKAELVLMLGGSGHGKVGECGILRGLADSSHDHGRLHDP
ncbi:MerR family transcriptional regulator [Rhizobium paknamense]|uniref:DNA-binding transcriptional MerR regulator n=1 Tax=Rhizobium paknamense TaxID=1206817 RepID=A0ABU0IEY4_9HYPH|nr:helix-turn-helix domain-containing protein [Rhizobium paknamense]MDQ0456262.1 DNA-binding transcriptional MerR regulator [Rhizobium paknamense]